MFRNDLDRVIPGNSIDDTYGFKCAERGKYAVAEFYQRQIDCTTSQLK